MSTTLPSNCTLSRNCTVWTITPSVHNNGHVNHLVRIANENKNCGTSTDFCTVTTRHPAITLMMSSMICGTGPRSAQRYDVLHDLWHWHTTISFPKNKKKPNTKTSVICGTGTPRSSPRARNGLQRQGRQQPCRRTARPPTNCNCGTSTVSDTTTNTGTSTTLSKSCRTAARPAPPYPAPSGTHFGAPGRRPGRCNNDRRIALYRALVSAGAWVTLPKEATPNGQVLRAPTPGGVSPIIGLVSLQLQTPG